MSYATERAFAEATGTGEPLLIFAPAPCPRCGARTEREGETMCRPQRDETGEGTCPVVDNPVATGGRFTMPTAESIAALDAWIDAKVRSEVQP